MRLVRKVLRGRCIRRPCFDFVEPKRNDDRRYSKTVQSFVSNYSAKQSGLKLGNHNNAFPVICNIVSNSTCSKFKGMALNKLSIDKVDLTDKRVLIRYNFPFSVN